MGHKKIEKLLSDTSENRTKALEKLKESGENFNIFSILKMESKENDTHSAFLGELLNPNGSHLKEDLFLSAFVPS